MVFINEGTPIAGWFMIGNPYMDDLLGYPCFRKAPDGGIQASTGELLHFFLMLFFHERKQYGGFKLWNIKIVYFSRVKRDKTGRLNGQISTHGKNSVQGETTWFQPMIFDCCASAQHGWNQEFQSDWIMLDVWGNQVQHLFYSRNST